MAEPRVVVVPAMREADIIRGGVYQGGAGQQRKVVAIDDGLVAWGHPMAGRGFKVPRGVCSLQTFASWARQEVGSIRCRGCQRMVKRRGDGTPAYHRAKNRAGAMIRCAG